MNLNGSYSKQELDEFEDLGFNEHQMAKLKKARHLQQRGNRNSTESVNELAQIMKDLSVLVIDQGTIVDRIDYIQNISASVELGEERESSKARGDGYACHSTCDHVFYNASPPDSEGDPSFIRENAIKNVQPHDGHCRSVC
ncbi:hypothetical protein M9H77_27380 [Catharanthus roseus]|uniref:Uncharacterized protein n=1 Tax=Catharanthus roseus TaxID=4058 RepID=A0ACC0ACB0_CATRO|nr:hypothetical protein M9H77_27380 [Catharanthus roseus]